MKLRFKFETEAENRIPSGDCDCDDCIALRFDKRAKKTIQKGLIVLESSPQIRTIFAVGNKGLARLPFPYVMYVVGYRREKEKYVYPGIYDAGLRVFFRNSPMEKYTDPVYYPPMDAARYGLVCTPHNHDNKVFDDLPSLANHAVTLWWNVVHGEISNEWKNLSIEECLNHNWDGGLSFPNALKKTEATGYAKNGYYPPDNSELVDELWPPVSITKSIENLQKLIKTPKLE